MGCWVTFNGLGPLGYPKVAIELLMIQTWILGYHFFQTCDKPIVAIVQYGTMMTAKITV